MADPAPSTVLREDLALAPTMNEATTAPLPKESRSVAPSSKIGRYNILRKLGEGGMGVVYAERFLSILRLENSKHRRQGTL